MAQIRRGILFYLVFTISEPNLDHEKMSKQFIKDFLKITTVKLFLSWSRRDKLIGHSFSLSGLLTITTTYIFYAEITWLGPVLKWNAELEPSQVR